jgi:hypothetical protein
MKKAHGGRGSQSGPSGSHTKLQELLAKVVLSWPSLEEARLAWGMWAWMSAGPEIRAGEKWRRRARAMVAGLVGRLTLVLPPKRLSQ